MPRLKPRSMNCSRAWRSCAVSAKQAQQQAAAVSALLAGLEERSRGAEAAFTRIDRMYGDLERRVNQLEQQLASATAEEQQRTRENEQLAVERRAA